MRKINTVLGVLAGTPLAQAAPAAEIQNYTSYTAALITAATSPDAARAFIRYMGSPAGKALFAANGIQ